MFKIYGGNTYDGEIHKFVKINSPSIQSLISYELSSRSWGPKLFGLEEGTRIEEFIDCHTLKGEEAFTPEICKETAKAFARFHSLKLPLPKKPFDILSEMFIPLETSKKELETFLSTCNDENTKGPFLKLLQFPYKDEYKWINQVRGKISQRVVFCAMDPNYLNRLVKHEKSNNPNESQIAIIDYDLSNYSHRGYDIGGHFFQRSFNWATGEILTPLPYPNKEERIFFLKCYLEECKKLFDDFDDKSLDTIENVTIEADFNILVHMLFMLILSTTMHKLLDRISKVECVAQHFHDAYLKFKSQFIADNPTLFVG